MRIANGWQIAAWLAQIDFTKQNLTIPIGTALRRFSPTRFIRRQLGLLGVDGFGWAVDKRYSLAINKRYHSMAATEEKEKQVYHSCASCDRDTWHSVLEQYVESEYEYQMDTIYQIVQCCGCHTVSFRKVVRDYESAYPIDDNEWDVPEDISCFPSILKGHRELEDVWDLPDTVREIYTQSIQAIKDNSNILAGIGLRATIEAICNDRGITGRTLEKRIDSLAKGGLISQKDTERLHAIRFLGNDAAHEIKSRR